MRFGPSLLMSKFYQIIFVLSIVGMAGIEPATSCPQNRRATAALHPVEPPTGFEPAIFALQKHCITIMLQGLIEGAYGP
jgi:hypothetical protein